MDRVLPFCSFNRSILAKFYTLLGNSLETQFKQQFWRCEPKLEKSHKKTATYYNHHSNFDYERILSVKTSWYFTKLFSITIDTLRYIFTPTIKALVQNNENKPFERSYQATLEGSQNIKFRSLLDHGELIKRNKKDANDSNKLHYRTKKHVFLFIPLNSNSKNQTCKACYTVVRCHHRLVFFSKSWYSHSSS